MPAETLTRTSPDATAASPVVPYGDYAPDAYAQRTYTPSEQRTAVLDPADTAPPLRYDQPATRPPLAEDVHAPIAPRLQYNGAQKERLRTHGPGYEEGMTPQQAREAWDADPSTVVLNSYQPLLSKEQVAEQLGTAFANLGALQGVIHLPHAEEPLYVFNRSTIEVGADGKENHVPRFVLATPTQLGKILTNAEIGRPSKQEIRDELLVLSRPLHGGGRQRATIGTDEWLPGRPYGPRSYPDIPVPQQYRDVDRVQAEIYLNPGGNLCVYEDDPRLPSTVEYNPQRTAAQDPFPGGPDNSYQDAYHPELAHPVPKHRAAE